MSIGKAHTAVMREDDGTVNVIFHETVIVKIAPDNTVTLDSGGWLTNTTKARMNEVAEEYNLNFSVFQDKKQWYVKVPGGNLAFHDGMTI